MINLCTYLDTLSKLSLSTPEKFMRFQRDCSQATQCMNTYDEFARNLVKQRTVVVLKVLSECAFAAFWFHF